MLDIRQNLLHICPDLIDIASLWELPKAMWMPISRAPILDN
jgi:hypothetical protein